MPQTLREPTPLRQKVDSPVAERSRQLFAYVAATENRTPPSASLLADRIEQYLHSEHVSDQPCRKPATEAELSRTFGVGRRLVRQASRLLQQRGVARPQRGGGGTGGLKPSMPEPMQVAQALADAVRHESDRRAVDDARSFLLPLISRDNGPLAGLLRGTLTCLESGAARDGVRMQSGGQAWRLAEELSRRMRETPSAPDALFLGSLDSIALQHDTSLEIAVEAVRLLEDRQTVALRRGRAGGVFATTGSTSQVAHMANAFFATSGVSTDECHRILSAINVEMIGLAARRATPVALERTRAALEAMAEAKTATEIGISWYPLQREFATMAESPVLHLVSRCLAASLLLRRLRTAELPDAGARELLDASRIIAGNLARGHERGNRREHWRCQRVLAQHW